MPLRSIRLRQQAARVAALAGLSSLLLACGAAPRFDGTVPVGILHSLSGTMAISEVGVAEAERLAVDEINAAGGVRAGGRRLKIEAIQRDGASEPRVFAGEAERLISQRRVAALFGGWTSASRKAMLPVLERHDHLLLYPVQYEGQECSRHVIYGGATPNQQTGPAIDWLLRQPGRAFLLVGSDYIYPRTANAIIREQLRRRGARLVGERYLPLGSTEVAPLITAIRRGLPRGGVLVNTLNGDSNVAFFQALRQAGLTPEHGYDVISFSVAEEAVVAIGAANLVGTHAAWSFFQSLDSDASRRFSRAFQERYGEDRVTDDPAVKGYTLVHLWARAVERAGSTEPRRVRRAMIGLSLDSPAGAVTVQPNHHLVQRTLIGRVQANGQFRIEADLGRIAPEPWSPLLAASRGNRCDWTLARPDAGRFRVKAPQ